MVSDQRRADSRRRRRVVPKSWPDRLAGSHWRGQFLCSRTGRARGPGACSVKTRREGSSAISPSCRG